MKIGFIGTGDIAEAVIIGMIRAEFPATEIAVSARSRHISSELAKAYSVVKVYEENQDVVDAGCDLVFLSVLPQQAEAVLTPLRFNEGQEIASLIATVPVETIVAWTGATGVVTRAVPLPPVADLRAVTVLSGPSGRLEDLFERLGGVIVAKSLEEMNALTVPSTLMGTFFGLQEVVTDWMGAKGVPEADARRFLSSLFLALARTGANSDKSLPELRKAHSTSGGLNAQVFEVFTEEGGPEALTKAMDSVMDRINSASKKADRIVSMRCAGQRAQRRYFMVYRDLSRSNQTGAASLLLARTSHLFFNCKVTRFLKRRLLSRMMLNRRSRG